MTKPSRVYFSKEKPRISGGQILVDVSAKASGVLIATISKCYTRDRYYWYGMGVNTVLMSDTATNVDGCKLEIIAKWRESQDARNTKDAQ